ncbi:MAG: peptidase, partial [Planctomycetota bacterium]|nr:peptidase [Planctomycetota bacterium]
IPNEILFRILQTQHQAESPEGYLATVRLLLSSRRFSDARKELERALEKFPRLAEELKGLRRQLHTQEAEQLLQEIELRRQAGRIQQSRMLLQQFPAGDEVAGEVLVQVREMQERDQREQNLAKQILEQVRLQVSQFEDAQLKPVLEAFQLELEQQLSPNNLDRFADYVNLIDDATLEPAQKLSLAMSGWLLGSGGDSATLTRVASLWEARELVTKYLRLRNDQELQQRDELLKRLLELEGTSPQSIAKLLANLRPPAALPAAQEDTPGLFRLAAGHASGLGPHNYFVQLPPEYDPDRRYPVIVTLHRTGSSPQQQLQWWCGPYDDSMKERLGQATRHGYIVIAPEWTTPEQLRYGFTAREHDAVLACLRDAFQRLSIDTDRVFISGHSNGGDAAWDIAQAHPDLWAGVIPIAATAEYNTSDAPKYIPSYIINAKLLSTYFVCGELDGDLTIRNSVVWDRYLKNGYDALVTEYRGRGHEMFGDEIQRIMTWANLSRRNFFPQEFKVVAMRPWDNFFWCVELDGYLPKNMVNPLEWDQAKAAPKATTEVKFPNDSTVVVRSAAKNVVLYLTPDQVDFSKPLIITIDGKSSREPVAPSVSTLLEDARTRGDRLHPFWAKVSNSAPTKK